MHRRSILKQQSRQIRRIIISTSFRDRIRSETVCRMTRTDVLAHFKKPIQVSLVPDLEKGEVLIDPRGKGSFQTEFSEE